jgi:hypothetical protein
MCTAIILELLQAPVHMPEGLSTGASCPVYLLYVLAQPSICMLQWTECASQMQAAATVRTAFNAAAARSTQ